MWASQEILASMITDKLAEMIIKNTASNAISLQTVYMITTTALTI